MEHSGLGDDASPMLTLTHPPITAPFVESPLRQALSPFAAMIGAAARLPLLPVADWTTRAAQALNAGSPGSASLVTLYNHNTRQVVHAGADSTLHPQPSSVLLLAQAEDLVRADLTNDDRRTRAVVWSDSMNHPFHEAGFGVGAVLRTRARIDEHLSIALDVYRAHSNTNPVECAMIDGVAEFLVQSLRSFVATRRPTHWLSARESDVLDLIVVGYSVNEIAEKLGRSPHTVHDHLKAIHRKTGATSRGQLIAAATGRRAVTTLDVQHTN